MEKRCIHKDAQKEQGHMKGGQSSKDPGILQSSLFVEVEILILAKKDGGLLHDAVLLDDDGPHALGRLVTLYSLGKIWSLSTLWYLHSEEVIF